MSLAETSSFFLLFLFCWLLFFFSLVFRPESESANFFFSSAAFEVHSQSIVVSLQAFYSVSIFVYFGHFSRSATRSFFPFVRSVASNFVIKRFSFVALFSLSLAAGSSTLGHKKCQKWCAAFIMNTFIYFK